MSIVLSLLLVLLYFSFHACDARSFEVLHYEPAKDFQHSISKGNDKLNPARVSIQPDRKASTLTTATRNLKQESRRLERAEKVNTEQNHEGQTRIDNAKGDRIKVPGTQKSKYAASVSWRVPHKKRGETEQGFNLDYLPPKTHPPVHN